MGLVNERMYDGAISDKYNAVIKPSGADTNKTITVITAVPASSGTTPKAPLEPT